MTSNITPESYSAVASHYDDELNETSFWGELARESYEAIVIKPRYEVILDVGCGTGLALHHLQGRAPSHVHLFGVEPSEEMRRLAERRNAASPNVELRDGRFESIPLPDDSVDYLYSLWAFHWSTDPRRAAEEIRRVLRRDGELDLRFIGLQTGGDFSRKVGEVLRRYVDLETRLNAASVMTSLDADHVHELFASFAASGLTVTEEFATHYASLESHWAWQIRSEAHYSVIAPEERARFDADLRAAIASLGDERGVP
jgi:ubiquinone/menaquinone biosynthesis C-methylase UbiE